MQTVWPVVDRKRVGNSVQIKRSATDSVRYATADRIEIRLFFFPFICRAKTQHDVFHFPFSVCYQQLRDLRSQVTDLDLQSSRALYGVELNCFHTSNIIHHTSLQPHYAVSDFCYIEVCFQTRLLFVFLTDKSLEVLDRLVFHKTYRASAETTTGHTAA